ncbi:hypothetical protein Tco_0886942 [Tanacetum coccineum]
MEVDIEEDENEPELTYPYEEVDPLNPSPPASESEPEEVIEDNDDLLPCLIRRDINSLFGRMASLLRRLCGREMAHALVEKKGKAKDEYYGKLILDLCNDVRSGVEKGMDAMEKLVEKLDMIRRGFVFEERPNKAINVLIEDEKSPSSEPRGSPHDS